MRRAQIAALVTVGALATTGTALAAGGGDPVSGIFGDSHQQQFAKDLAGQLGVSQSKVESALQNVAAQQQTEQTRAFAESLAKQLNGVSVDDITGILDEQQQKLEEQMKSGQLPPMPKQGSRPNPADSPLVAALADGLGKSKSEIANALEAAGKAEFKAHRQEIGPGGPGGPPPIGMGFPGPGGPGGPGEVPRGSPTP